MFSSTVPFHLYCVSVSYEILFVELCVTQPVRASGLSTVSTLAQVFEQIDGPFKRRRLQGLRAASKVSQFCPANGYYHDNKPTYKYFSAN